MEKKLQLHSLKIKRPERIDRKTEGTNIYIYIYKKK